MTRRVAIVTGAGRGIGKGIARGLASQGIHVVINDIDEKLADQTSREIGEWTSTYVSDVSDYGAVSQMVADVVDRFGTIDIVVNNAGISPKKEGKKIPLHEMDAREWQQVMEVNLNGAFHLIRSAAPFMIQQQFGRIVNISSIAAKSYISVSGGHYAATKAGLIGLTKAAAGELAPYGITVNALAPGRIETEMMAEAGMGANQQILSQIASGKFGKPEDIAQAVEFLASEKASYITGAVLNIDGGWVMA
ncbi:SDR family oxidoreductase [Effusibacillus lacus]|uniref:3-ketoacyl-ACP reductase n=1 Tax=Effusibacillus lacus TaxID=1348429 RepID=A0A292YFS4_9BACL|nr:SDR family NAD(P)-dependent oxidoreductase [Effusibacillus lacus]TCS75555.1 3-oxoacyl-[acyl-carrier protein] reductase [Effusibacillus lacus]GAX89017.1 3-ketoacyl-ACP reductase [Effusibacillus lacus]